MPDPNQPTTPTSASQTLGWFQDAPGGDLNLDDLFPNPELAAPQAPLQVTPPQVPQSPQAAPQPFIKTATGTVYNTVEDAVKGTEEKDRIIAELRAQRAAESGQDPLRRQAAQTPSQPPQADYDSQIFKRYEEAATKRDAKAYLDAQRQLILDTLAPYAPMIAEAGREKAIRTIASNNPHIREFVGSSEYLAVLAERPLLADAIRNAESNPQAVGQLNEFYSIAYDTAVARRVPQIAQAAAQHAAQQPPQSRPTLTPSTLPPAPYAPAAGGISDSNLGTREGRKAIIEAGRQRLDSVDWSKVGL